MKKTPPLVEQQRMLNNYVRFYLYISDPIFDLGGFKCHRVTGRIPLLLFPIPLGSGVNHLHCCPRVTNSASIISIKARKDVEKSHGENAELPHQLQSEHLEYTAQQDVKTIQLRSPLRRS